LRELYECDDRNFILVAVEVAERVIRARNQQQ
jgi:hypothetical protein